MQELVTVTGMVLQAVPFGEYDRRLILLTKEKGKITVFANGARRQNSRFGAGSDMFAFGKFRLYETKTSYKLSDMEIQNFFEELRQDYEAAYYGMYFLEIAEYYGQENMEAVDLLKLLYLSLRALSKESLKNPLIRAIFELRAIAINGELPEHPPEGEWQESTRYAYSYIMQEPIEKLYTFTVSDSVLEELKQIAKFCCNRYMDKKFKTLEILNSF